MPLHLMARSCPAPPTVTQADRPVSLAGSCRAGKCKLRVVGVGRGAPDRAGQGAAVAVLASPAPVPGLPCS